MKIAFDVDGTLLKLNDEPNWITVLFMIKLHEAGHYIIVWSGSGKDYAEQRIRDIDNQSDAITVLNSVDQYMSKLQNPGDIDLSFDDQDVTLAKLNVRL